MAAKNETNSFKQKHKGYRVIAIASRKGGTGKSSTTVNLAQALRICNKNVVIVDADDQHSIVTWEELAHLNNRHEKYGNFYPDVVAADNAVALHNFFRNLDENPDFDGVYDYVIIDTAGHLNQIREGGLTSELFNEIIVQSDMLLMTNTPDLFSVESNKEGCKLLNERIELLGENLVLRSLLNNIPTRLDSGSRKSIAQYEELEKSGEFWKFFNTKIYHSRRVAASLNDGSNAFIPQKEVCAEWYDSLMKEIVEDLGGNPQTILTLRDRKKKINDLIRSDNLIPAKKTSNA